LDRIDVHVSVPPVEVSALTSGAKAESSAQVRSRVCATRSLQRERCRAGLTSQPLNAALSANELDEVAALEEDARRLLHDAIQSLGLSARAFVRVRRVARTIADLEGEPHVRAAHVSEAIQGRMLDREVLG